MFGFMTGSRRVVTMGLRPPKIQYSAFTAAARRTREMSLVLSMRTTADEGSSTPENGVRMRVGGLALQPLYTFCTVLHLAAHSIQTVLGQAEADVPSCTTCYSTWTMLEEASVSYRRHWKDTVTQTSTHVYETAEGDK